MDYQDLVDNVLTQQRIQRYGSLNPSDLPETIARYLWNMGLCESLYPLLNGLEVALRNRVHHTLWTRTGKVRWMDPKWTLLHTGDLNQVKKTTNRLRREKKPQGVDRIIAAMSLGFWVGLFSGKYERQFWTGHSLRSVFPNAPRKQLGCHLIRRKLYRIRYLRNRVFHHEPIWHWAELDDTYQDIIWLISWLSTDWAKAIAPYDRFKQVHGNSYKPYLDVLTRNSENDYR